MPKLTRENRRLFLLTTSSLALALVLGKIQRLWLAGVVLPWRYAVGVIPEIGTTVGFTVFAALALRDGGSARRQFAVLGLWTTLFYIELVNTSLFYVARAYVDFDTLIYGTTQIQMLWVVVREQVPPAAWVLLAALLSVATAVAVALLWRACGKRQTSDTPLSKMPPLAWALVPCILAAMWTPSASGDTGVDRGTLCTLVRSRFLPDHAPMPVPTVPTDPAADRETHLVREGPARAKHVVIVWLESTGAMSTSLYPGGVKTTPWLESLAPHAVLADRAVSVVTHSTKSMIPMFCSATPALTLQVWASNPRYFPWRCLPELLREEGWATAFISSMSAEFEAKREIVRNAGFTDIVAFEDLDLTGFDRVNYFGVEEDALLGPSAKWVAAHRDQPFLMLFMTGTSHDNYGLPASFEREQLDPVNRKRDSYLNAIRYLDRFSAKLYQQFEDLGLNDDTLWLFLGDHGEAFDEHRRIYHDYVPYEEGLWVPWLWYQRGEFVEPQRVHETVSHLDVAPSIAQWLGYRLEGPSVEGQSIFLPIPADRILFSSCFYRSRCATARQGSLKLVYHFDRRPTELFDLASDPGEHVNLAEQRPQDAKRLLEAVRGWVGRAEDHWTRLDQASH